MSVRDLIIGCSTNYDWSKLKYWVNSINKSGFEGDKVLILMNCDKDTVAKLTEEKFIIIGFKKDDNDNLVYQSSLPVHTERFLHIYNFLKDRDYRYVITTDVKDVVFQKNPIEYLQKECVNKNLVFSSESIRYKDEPWGDNNLKETFGPYVYEQFKNEEIFNVGVLAGHGYAIRDLALNIFLSCLNRPIPICDQSTFNVMISRNPYTTLCKYTRSEEGWAAQLGTTGDPSKAAQFDPLLLEAKPKLKDGVVTTSTGKEYYIVHQYDRVPNMRKVIEERFA